MIIFILKRSLQAIPVFIGATLLLFIVLHLIPGDPVQLLSGARSMDPERYQTIKHELFLDRPIHEQYLHYMNQLVHGDLGTSYQKGRPVSEILLEKLPASASLAGVAIVIEVFVGIIAGVLSVLRRSSFLDVLVTLTTTLLVAVPVFWLGLLLQLLFGLRLEWFPVSGYGDGGWRNYVLPGFTLAAVSMAYVARLMRSQLKEVVGEEYIRAARARGLPARSVYGKHALRNGLIPVVTFIGVDLGMVMGGAILTETVFNWPGVGFVIYLAILQRDYPVVLGGVMMLVGLFLLINLIVDILYAYLDPRIRFGKAEAV